MSLDELWLCLSSLQADKNQEIDAMVLQLKKIQQELFSEGR